MILKLTNYGINYFYHIKNGQFKVHELHTLYAKALKWLKLSGVAVLVTQ